MSTRLVSTPNGRPEVNTVGGIVDAWFETGSEVGSEAGFEARFEVGFKAISEAGLESSRELSTKADDGAATEVGMA